MISFKKLFFRMRHPIQGRILCLHRVIPQRSYFKENFDIEITPDFLEKLIIQYKRDGYEFHSIDYVYNSIRENRFSFKKFICITFDDGFSDIYHYAYPILIKYKIPFTIYLTSDFASNRGFIWWKALEDIILDNELIVLNNGLKYESHTHNEKSELFSELIKDVFNSIESPSDYFKKMFQKYNEKFNIYSALALNWEQVKEMSRDNNCTIGSHSASHPILTKIDNSKLLDELVSSKSTIESHINKEVNHFSYPHGFCNQHVQNYVEKAGYKSAVKGYGGPIRYDIHNFYQLPRVHIVQEY